MLPFLRVLHFLNLAVQALHCSVPVADSTVSDNVDSGVSRPAVEAGVDVGLGAATCNRLVSPDSKFTSGRLSRL